MKNLINYEKNIDQLISFFYNLKKILTLIFWELIEIRFKNYGLDFFQLKFDNQD